MTEQTALETATETADKLIGESVEDKAPKGGIDHRIAFDMYRKAVENNSSLDPGGRILFRTLAETDLGELEPFPVNWEKLAQLAYQECRMTIKARKPLNKAEVGVRVMEPVFTKKNRVRMVKDDPKSPMGTIIKYDLAISELHKPYAVATFSADEAFRYAVGKLPDEPSWLKSIRAAG